MLVSITAFTHTIGGQVEWGLVPSLLAGSIPGVLTGSFLAAHLPGKAPAQESGRGAGCDRCANDIKATLETAIRRR